jgi:hypothetical protein
VSDEDAEALEIGRIVQRDGEQLLALRAYLAGKKRGQNTANAGAVPRRGSDVGTSPLLGLPGSED